MKPLDYTHNNNRLITKYGTQYGDLKIASWRIWNLGIRLVIKEPILIHEVLIPPSVYIIGLWRTLHSASSHKLYHSKSEADYRQKMMRIWYDETGVTIHSTKSNGRIASNPKLIFLTTLLHMNQKLQQSHPYTVTPSISSPNYLMISLLQLTPPTPTLCFLSSTISIITLWHQSNFPQNCVFSKLTFIL